MRMLKRIAQVRIPLLGLLGLLAMAAPAVRAAQAYSPTAVKAAFLYRFAGYVEWPAAQAGAAVFSIAVLGESEVADQLEQLLPMQTIHGRPAQVRRIHRVSEIGDAQMLFIAATAAKDLRAQIAPISSKPVLVVTDDTRGLDAGSTLNFVEVDRRIRFEVSLGAAERAGLKISSELLSVAMRVEGGRLRSDTSCEGLGFEMPGALCPRRMARRFAAIRSQHRAA